MTTKAEQVQAKTQFGIPIDESFGKAASEESLQKTAAALRTRNFAVEVVNTPADARAYVTSLLPKDQSIFTASSETLRLSGLEEDIKQLGQVQRHPPTDAEAGLQDTKGRDVEDGRDP
jgi:LUD domain